MVAYVFLGLSAIFICFWLIKYYVENGYYFPLSRKYGVRRYVFPQGAATLAMLRDELKKVCRETLNGELLEYPFLHDEPKAFDRRVVCVFYERKDPSGTPVAFHAPFVVTWKRRRIFHCGLMMVVPQHQRQGIQSLSAWNVFLYFLFHRLHILTEIAASSSYLTIQDNTQDDVYPVWQHPDIRPKQWHLDVTRYMLTNYRHEFGCSKFAVLDEATLVVCKSNAKEGGGAWQLVKTVQSRKSSSSEKEKFIEDRLNNNEGDEQFYVGKPHLAKMLIKTLTKGKPTKFLN